MQKVSITTKTEAKINSTIEEISLCSDYANRTQEQVCRTCTRTSNKFWAHDQIDIAKAKMNPDVDVETLKCHPTSSWGDVKVVNNTDQNNRILPISAETADRTRAFVDTCGHDVRRECLSCERFMPIEVDIAYPSNPESEIKYRVVEQNGKSTLKPYTTDGSTIRSWKVAIGGSCSLPVEGIQKNGKNVYCDFKAKGKRVESPSCANCFYLDYAGDNWQFDYLEVNENAALTPWERELATKAAEYNDMPLGQALGLALWKKQTEGFGRVLSFAVQILRKDYHNGELKYKVRFVDNNVIAVFSAYNASIYVNDDAPIGYNFNSTDTNAVHKGVAEIIWPHHKQFGLGDNLKVRRRIWPDLPEKISIRNNNFDELVDDKCPRCNVKKNSPCYYHSKRPRYNFVKGIVEFTTGRQTPEELQFPPHGILHIELREGTYFAVDGNGNLPEAYGEIVANATVFRLYLPELLRKAKAKYGKQAAKDIFSQYNKVSSMLHFSNPIKVRPSWLKPSGVEPSKPRCTNPNGLDLRKVFMDSFGSERVDIDFDLGAHNTATVEEELRVGYRQHAQTVQRLHEEILATLTSHPKYKEEIGGIISQNVKWPEEMIVTKIDAIGGMYYEDGTPITSVEEFMNRLDEQVVMGQSGDVDRMFSIRQQLYGYEMSRGYFGSRRGKEKSTMPSLENEMVIFSDHGEPDQIDISDAWRCPNCDRQYNQTDILNWFSPTCECGSALYKNHTSRVTYNARATGGIGNALSMDTAAMRQKQMLYASLCPKWRLNTPNSIVRLEDLGNNSSSPVQEVAVSINTNRRPEVYKVGGFLTEEQKQSNAEYEIKRNKIYALREEYKEKFPESSIQELESKFPLPEGTIYVEKAAGSLAKMGSI
jgi:hypothetical protein